MVDNGVKKLTGREINKCVHVLKQVARKHYISIHNMKSKGSQEKEEQETGRNSGLSAINKRDKVKPTEGQSNELDPCDEPEQNKSHFHTFCLLGYLSPSFMVMAGLCLTIIVYYLVS